MKILGIETSCDETGIALVENGRKILSNALASSKEMHNKYGGVYPEIAARAQLEVIIPVLDQAIKQAFGNSQNWKNKFDAIAVTSGPGLKSSLLVGVETAKTLAVVLQKPIIGVNHVLAHLYANWLINPEQAQRERQPSFPALGLIVSGGHTLLVYLVNHGKFKVIGTTLDDAAGEAFDKTARLLGFSYPGGPEIANAATKFKIQSASPDWIGANWRTKFQIKLPRPMIKSTDLNFSFSGLKTAVLREVQKYKKHNNNSQLPADLVNAFAYEIQEAITDVLVAKTLKAASQLKLKSILLAGGVAANTLLKEKFLLEIRHLKLEIPLFIPPVPLCTDNAAMIASCAYYNFKPVSWKKITAIANFNDFF